MTTKFFSATVLMLLSAGAFGEAEEDGGDVCGPARSALGNR
jgi:hypothetical protein